MNLPGGSSYPCPPVSSATGRICGRSEFGGESLKGVCSVYTQLRLNCVWKMRFRLLPPTTSWLSS